MEFIISLIHLIFFTPVIFERVSCKIKLPTLLVYYSLQRFSTKFYIVEFKNKEQYGRKWNMARLDSWNAEQSFSEARGSWFDPNLGYVRHMKVITAFPFRATKIEIEIWKLLTQLQHTVKQIHAPSLPALAKNPGILAAENRFPILNKWILNKTK